MRKIAVAAATVLAAIALRGTGGNDIPPPKPTAAAAEFHAVRPLVQTYCLNCHSTKLKKGSLDLERFATADDARKDVKPWEQAIEQLEAGEMPPADKPQPTAAEKKRLIAAIRGLLDAEARARSGDPGYVPLRRLSNAEYDNTIRDLTGVDLKPTREFPADGAGGEGFTNAAEALTDISPALFTKYLNAAKETAGHAVLLPDGFRFSPSGTRRDWTNEETAKLRQFYAEYAGGEGKLAVQPYLAAAVRHRDVILAKKSTPDEVAAREKLNPKYFGILWQALTDNTPSQPLEGIRTRWRTATANDVPSLTAEITAWQTKLWATARIGSYVQPVGTGFAESLTRQIAIDPPASESVAVRVAVKPVPGQSDVTIRLEASGQTPGRIIWHRPRFEAAGKPTLLLHDYGQYGPAFEADFPTAFGAAAQYLAAVRVLAPGKQSADEYARAHGLNAVFLKRWVELLALAASDKSTPAVPLDMLSERTPRNPVRPAVLGWHKPGADLPVLFANSSDAVEEIPGRVSPHGVSVHPLPKEFVAVAWKSPIAGTVSISLRVSHAHPACGNGVAWWVERRRGGRATALGEGAVDLGKETKPPAKTHAVEIGDVLLLAVDARNGDHVCDMTDIAFSITEADTPNRKWDLGKDVSPDVQAGNPHADRHGNVDTWSFVRGPSKGGPVAPPIPPDSVLGRWRAAVTDPKRHADTEKLAAEVQALLSGPRPKAEKAADRVLYDKLVAVESPLFAGVDVTKVAKPRPPGATPFGLPAGRFGAGGDTASLVAAEAATEFRVPAALLVGREFTVDARLDGPAGDRAVEVRASVAPSAGATVTGGGILGSPNGAGYKRIVDGYAEFRRLFPLYLCFPNVVPTDEVVSLKMFHREDDALIRLFLDDAAKARLEKLWATHRFVSRQAVAENDYLPQFIGFVTQDQPKTMLAYFEGQRPAFQKRADEFLKAEEAAVPNQLDALWEFAGRAYRRPLTAVERSELMNLYKALRGKGVPHDEAFRGVLSRIFVAPAFLFRIEHAPPGPAAGPVNDWELATRLSYFLWASAPDGELRTLAAAGSLRDPAVLAAQVRRLTADPRVRGLAVEFGTQWLHVRGFDRENEKNEKLFPTFDPALKSAMNEEAVQFFRDAFANDRAVTDLLKADYVFVNDRLAQHYGIPGVTGPQWRKIDGARKYGRGGVLGFASVQAKQSGASRTSPVLRGNWVVETLLGEKLPRPPANVPRLPEEEGGGGLTVRQQVERHAKAPECAVCHVRIDPYGFALERYDAIGRLREKDSAGLPVDAHAKLKDGTAFDGLDGLRDYLLTKKKDVFVRLFCKRLLGYALGRSVTLSDHALLDEMVAELTQNGGKLSAAVRAIVRSPQFRNVRGADAVHADGQR